MSVNCPNPTCPTCKLSRRMLDVLKDSEDCAESLVALANVLAHVINNEARGDLNTTNECIAAMDMTMTRNILILMHNRKTAN